jgi:hypothetical protein
VTPGPKKSKISLFSIIENEDNLKREWENFLFKKLEPANLYTYLDNLFANNKYLTILNKNCWNVMVRIINSFIE